MRSPRPEPDAEELLQLAVRATRANDVVRANELLQRCLALEPRSAPAWLLLAGLLASAGSYQEAGHAFFRAIEYDPTLHHARFQAGPLQLTQGDVAAAAQTWRPLEELGAEHPLCLFKRGLEHLARNEFAQCIDALHQGLERNRANPSLNADMLKVISEAQNALPLRSRVNLAFYAQSRRRDDSGTVKLLNGRGGAGRVRPGDDLAAATASRYDQ